MMETDSTLKSMWRLRYCKIFFLTTCCLLLSAARPLMSQCFSSSGNPVGGSQNMGALEQGVVTVMAFGRYGYFNRYFEGSQESEVDIIDYADYSYGGLLTAYGVTYRLSLEAELGYFGNKTKRYSFPDGYRLRGSGLSNALLSAKYRVWNHAEKNLAWTLSAGLKLPFSRTLQSQNHVRLPFDIQPSTGAFGLAMQSFLVHQNSFSGMRYFFYNRLDVNGRSRDGYRYGPSLTTSIFVSKHLVKTSSWPVSFTLITQFRNEYKAYNYIYDQREDSSGSFRFFFTPQLNLAIQDVWNVSIMLDLPVYQHYNHIQLAENFSAGVSLTRIISPYSY